MSNCPFCNLDPAPHAARPDQAEPSVAEPKLRDEKRPTSFLRRVRRSAEWLFPAALLVLIPKCPLCVAAYVALFTGIGITVSTARWIQILMLALSSTSLVYLVVRYWRTRRPRMCITISPNGGQGLGG
jgi:hypothetical protein